jgi:N-acetyl-gamma-glutamyl-phosphate reductase
LKARVVIIGAGGYTGAELAEILLSHPDTEVAGLFASGTRSVPALFSDLFPRFRGRLDSPVRAYSAGAVEEAGAEAAFLATPHEASVSIAAELLDRGVKVFDLSAAFRLKEASLYPRYYGFEHPRPDLLAGASYGLPELTRGAIAAADLVACAGCYPTSAILPLSPLVRAGAVRRGTRPIVDSTSGVSGAGRAPGARTHFCEVSYGPYGVLEHRHGPEIDAYAGVPVVFTPHLAPYERGIVSTIHVELAPGWSGDRVAEALHIAYDGEPFVRFPPARAWPTAASVERTNFCDMAWAVDDSAGHLVLVSAIDNLVKGASGQAVQCMNIRLGLAEDAGLPSRSSARPEVTPGRGS